MPTAATTSLARACEAAGREGGPATPGGSPILTTSAHGCVQRANHRRKRLDRSARCAIPIAEAF
eukprot:5910343-Alexandrium_andersonii.AAC.1